MMKMLNMYMNTVRPTANFVGMSYFGGKLKIAFDTHTDIATMENGELVITRE